MRYPPKNIIDMMADIPITLQYSERKKKAKANDEYSVANPLTSSDSASLRSNGVLFVSAKAPIKNIIPIPLNGTINHSPFCISTIDVKFVVSPNIIISIIITAITIS